MMWIWSSHTGISWGYTWRHNGISPTIRKRNACISGWWIVSPKPDKLRSVTSRICSVYWRGCIYLFKLQGIQETVHLFLENWHGSGGIEFLGIGTDIYVLMLLVQTKVLCDKTPMIILMTSTLTTPNRWNFPKMAGLGLIIHMYKVSRQICIHTTFLLL